MQWTVDGDGFKVEKGKVDECPDNMVLITLQNMCLKSVLEAVVLIVAMFDDTPKT